MNRYRRIVRDIAPGVCAMLLLCAAFGVPAQSIYKQVDAAGRITYTDRPEAATSVQPAADPALEVANALASNTAISSRRAAMVDVNEAERRLRQAELERTKGAERLPGEQVRGADAGAADDQYRKRQEELRRVVERARLRLSELHWSFRKHP